jgi:carbamoyl-phosphate synthase large subunit
MHKILLTGAGSGGGENLIRSLRAGSLELEIYGSNMDEHVLARSAADRAVFLPSARDEEYTGVLRRVVEREGIELVIPNNDTEVGRLSRDRDRIPCAVFLPAGDTVTVCQDKLQMHRIFEDAGIAQAVYRGLESFEDIEAFMDDCPCEKYWVRPRRGSGSMGATWIEKPHQARAWISLWMELRGLKLTDFIISEFLPGRDYAFQSVWKDGRPVVAKLVERLVYFLGRNRLSNMSSTPAVARTLRDDKALETIFKAIHAVAESPHGNFCLDLKGRSDGTMCITEFNIGRFCMITPIFDLTGKYNTAEMHVRAALDLEIDVEDPIDIEENCYLLRDLDTMPTILREAEFNRIIEGAKALSE